MAFKIAMESRLRKNEINQRFVVIYKIPKQRGASHHLTLMEDARNFSLRFLLYLSPKSYAT